MSEAEEGHAVLARVRGQVSDALAEVIHEEPGVVSHMLLWHRATGAYSGWVTGWTRHQDFDHPEDRAELIHFLRAFLAHLESGAELQ